MQKLSKSLLKRTLQVKQHTAIVHRIAIFSIFTAPGLDLFSLVCFVFMFIGLLLWIVSSRGFLCRGWLNFGKQRSSLLELVLAWPWRLPLLHLHPRRRSSVNLWGEDIFAGRICITKCRNCTRLLPEKLAKYPNFYDVCPKN